MKNLLSVEQLAACLHKSVSSVRSDATRNPQSLPPICRLPGTKRLLWRSDDVEAWLSKYVRPSASEITPQIAKNSRKRGRPTKAEQIMREGHDRPMVSKFRKSEGVA